MNKLQRIFAAKLVQSKIAAVRLKYLFPVNRSQRTHAKLPQILVGARRVSNARFAGFWQTLQQGKVVEYARAFPF